MSEQDRDEEVDIQPGNWHKVFADEYEMAVADAAGTISGWMLGNGVNGPHWSEEFHEGFRLAVAAAFNRGFHVGSLDAALDGGGS